ncbi:phospholipase D-like domain-containing protein [Rossellomorea vietnamensis]|uniref:phospholipase D-like domain-containing protein n=1 Tax=Rossellomorea vietnamensis TaxID=218284 RepID=UPI003CEBC959
MSIRAYCHIPKKLSEKAPEGSCPELLYDLMSELEGATEVHIASYLFNNPILFEFLSEMAKKGCEVIITSLPLRGYKDKPTKVKGYLDKISGQDMARQIYEKIYKTANMQLNIFPHLYSWYGALYAGGGASYSFHVKSIYAVFPNTSKCFITSGNFMFTDPYHSENMLVIEEEIEYRDTFVQFFKDLETYAVPYEKFKSDFKEEEQEFLYSFYDNTKELSKAESRNCFFTAPFYKYDEQGSNHYAGERIIELIKNAENRIWLCAQHFHDISSFDTERSSIINAIYDKHLLDSDVEFKFLKQVPHSSLADKRRAAIAETLFQYVINAEQRYNRLTHDKFIIIDDTLVVSTANYTSTQFAYGVRPAELKANKKIKKLDVFSEVNSFVVIPNCPPEVIEQYEKHFLELWNTGEVIKINI